MLNCVILIGRLTAEPETRRTITGDIPVTRFTIAVDRQGKRDEKGNRQTDFIRIVTWRNLADICSKYLRKGMLVGVEGRLQIRSYNTPDGEKRTMAEVIADNVQFLERGAAKDVEEQKSEDDENLSQYVEKLDSDLDETIELEEKDPFKDL